MILAMNLRTPNKSPVWTFLPGLGVSAQTVRHLPEMSCPDLVGSNRFWGWGSLCTTFECKTAAQEGKGCLLPTPVLHFLS